MKLLADITSVIDGDGDLSVTMRGWAETDPIGTVLRPLGTVNIPSNDRNRKAFHVGRRVKIDVTPA